MRRKRSDTIQSGVNSKNTKSLTNFVFIRSLCLDCVTLTSLTHITKRQQINFLKFLSFISFNCIYPSLSCVITLHSSRFISERTLILALICNPAARNPVSAHIKHYCINMLTTYRILLNNTPVVLSILFELDLCHNLWIKKKIHSSMLSCATLLL